MRGGVLDLRMAARRMQWRLQHAVCAYAAFSCVAARVQDAYACVRLVAPCSFHHAAMALRAAQSARRSLSRTRPSDFDDAHALPVERVGAALAPASEARFLGSSARPLSGEVHLRLRVRNGCQQEAARDRSVHGTVTKGNELLRVHVFDAPDGFEQRVGGGCLCGDDGLGPGADPSHGTDSAHKRASIDAPRGQVDVCRLELQWDAVLRVRREVQTAVAAQWLHLAFQALTQRAPSLLRVRAHLQSEAARQSPGVAERRYAAALPRDGHPQKGETREEPTQIQQTHPGRPLGAQGRE